MRSLFILSLLPLLFGLFIVPVFAATYQCPDFPSVTGDTLQECDANCPNGCGLVSGNGGTNDSSSSGSSGSSFGNPLDSDTFEELVLALTQWVAAIALPIVVIFIIYSGYLFVTAGGNQSKIDAAKTTFYWTIIGAAIVVGAWALASAIVDFAQKL